MRILAPKPEGKVIPFIFASMKKAFRVLGQEVIEFPFPRGHGEMEGFKSLASIGPVAVFSLDLPLDPNMRSILKEYHQSIKIPWVIWFVDDPDGYGFPNGFDPAWTIVFCWDKEITRQITARVSWKGIPPIHLPLASDPELFYPEEDVSPLLFPGGVFVGSTAHSNPIFDEAILNSSDFEEIVLALWDVWKSDLGQVPQELVWGFLQAKTGIGLGALQKDPLARLWAHSTAYALGGKKRKEIVSRVISEGGGVFGNRDWEPIMGKYYRGEVAYEEGLRRIYQTSSFALETRQPQSRTGITQRLFDASACGIPVLAEYSPELEDYFSPHEEILSFRTLDEALERKKEILSGQGSRLRAARARNRVLAQHTFRHRAARILEAVQRFFAVSRA
jgi:spore maturation protein CgeB